MISLDYLASAMLATVLQLPQPMAMIPLEYRAALRKLECQGLVWIKNGNWMGSDKGEKLLADCRTKAICGQP